MHKTIRQRIVILSLLLLPLCAIYGLARYFSPAIITSVVKEALIQKAPDGMSRESVAERFDRWIESAQKRDKINRLLDLSSFLEKVQKLTAEDLDRLLGKEAAGLNSGQARFRKLFGTGYGLLNQTHLTPAVETTLWRMVP